MKQEKVTLLDIANAVGCSKGLVSLALSDSTLVSEESRSEIILTALKLGYNLNKRKIKESKKKTVSLVVDDISYVNEFFWEEIVKSIVETLAEKNILLDLVVYNDGIDKDGMLLSLVDKKSDGILVVAKCDDKKLASLSQSRLPIVLLDADKCSDISCDSVSASNYSCGRYAADYFIKKGHKSVAFAGSTEMAISFKQRRNGFADGVAEHKNKVKFYDISKNGTKDCAMFDKKGLLKALRSENPPTAVFCANDVTACDVFDLFEKEGLKVPEDVSLIGFDKIEKEHPLLSFLDTFVVDKTAFAKTAVNLLTERIESPQAAKKHIEIACSLVEGKSVKSFI